VRAGTYRIITAIEDNNFVVTAISVGHRKSVSNYSGALMLVRFCFLYQFTSMSSRYLWLLG